MGSINGTSLGSTKYHTALGIPTVWGTGNLFEHRIHKNF